MSERAISFAKVLANRIRGGSMTFSAAWDVFECAEIFMADEEARAGHNELVSQIGVIDLNTDLKVGTVPGR